MRKKYKSKYKVGDRVRAIAAQDSNEDIVGRCGVIIAILDDNIYMTVEFDEKIRRGHSGYNGNGTQGYCWNVVPEVIEFENQYKVDLI